MPAAAQRALLAQLVSGGARLRYHGDFDWPGLIIGNRVMREFGAQPWRYGMVDYRAAVAAAETENRHPLTGTRIDAEWDAGLAEAMLDHGRAVDEEGVIDMLLSDLSQGF